jgi:hypothetical protein
MNPRKLIIPALAAAIAALLYLVVKDPVPITPQPTNASATSQGATTVTSAPSVNAQTTTAALPAKNTKTPPNPAEKPTEPPGPAAWEMKIDQVLQSNVEHSTMALTLLKEIPAMPADGQTATAQHIANLISDNDFEKLFPYLQNTQLAPGFLEILTADSLNRPDKVKLPTLLLAAKTANHPMSDTAKGFLSVLVGEDHGTNWNLWDQSIKKIIAESAAQNAPTNQ